MYTSSAPNQAISPGARAYARIGIESAEILVEGNAISKAINIVDNGLKASLDATDLSTRG
ncbi:flagellar protein FliS [Collimonas sp. OK607]|uniref:hypothetical protein n=1 Tax=Collimonas sp. OK607 TaxID=1798194 RepID=UPI0008E46EEE|nr:hypothetical protein [Collimonas sp. OK607]SFB22460.1 flagellar protein FliS [Collimonas sp. OK607]